MVLKKLHITSLIQYQNKIYRMPKKSIFFHYVLIWVIENCLKCFKGILSCLKWKFISLNDIVLFFICHAVRPIFYLTERLMLDDNKTESHVLWMTVITPRLFFYFMWKNARQTHICLLPLVLHLLIKTSKVK